MEKLDLGPVQKLLDDPSVSEIMINGAEKIFIEKNGKKVLSDVRFGSEAEVKKLVASIYSPKGKRVDRDVPYADCCLDDGTRINAIISPVSRFGMSVTFRKFSKDINSVEDLIKLDTLDRKAADFLIACVKGKINMLFSGGTAVGKTTLLQLLSGYFAPTERVITIEDAAELKLEQDNVISLETRTPDREGKGEVALRDLIRNALRMAPDRLVIGEVRGPEAIDMIQAMATGHSGTIGVVHGNSPREVVSRLETMILMSGINIPLWEVRKLIASTIHMIVHLDRFSDGSRKITYITEIRGLEREEIAFNNLFMHRIINIDEHGKVFGTLKPCIRYYPKFFQKLQKLSLVSDKIFVNE